MQKIIDRIEQNVEYLLKLDWCSPKNVIQKTEFELFHNNGNNDHLLQAVTGSKQIKDWTDFKIKFCNYQAQIGFDWIAVRGQGGPLKLERITIGNIGEKISNYAHSKNIGKKEDASFKLLLSGLFEKLFNNYGIEHIDYSDARNSFKENVIKNTSYKFRRGKSSDKFKLSTVEYSYQPQKKGCAEQELGDRIEESIKNELDLTEINHVQKRRNELKYRNVDLEGFKIVKGDDGDAFSMYTFELKAKNSISAISEAISQASNYKSFSNFTYIVIPEFDHNSFHDTSRLNDFKERCKSSQIGIISIAANDNGNQNDQLEVNIVLPATDTGMQDRHLLHNLVKNSDWEKCPLCRNIVRKDREGCGWQVGSDNECMKELLEKKVLLGD